MRTVGRRLQGRRYSLRWAWRGGRMLVYERCRSRWYRLLGAWQAGWGRQWGRWSLGRWARHRSRRRRPRRRLRGCTVPWQCLHLGKSRLLRGTHRWRRRRVRGDRWLRRRCRVPRTWAESGYQTWRNRYPSAIERWSTLTARHSTVWLRIEGSEWEVEISKVFCIWTSLRHRRLLFQREHLRQVSFRRRRGRYERSKGRGKPTGWVQEETKSLCSNETLCLQTR